MRGGSSAVVGMTADPFGAHKAGQHMPAEGSGGGGDVSPTCHRPPLLRS